MNRKTITAFILIILSLILPFIFKSMLMRHFLVLIGINVILVMSLDLVTGHIGLTSLGHAFSPVERALFCHRDLYLRYCV